MPEDAVSSGSNARRARRSPSSNGAEPSRHQSRKANAKNEGKAAENALQAFGKHAPRRSIGKFILRQTRLRISQACWRSVKNIGGCVWRKSAAVLRGISHIKPQKREAPLRGTLPSFARMSHQILVMFFSFSIFTKAYSPRSPRVCTSAQSPLTLQICTRPLFFNA